MVLNTSFNENEPVVCKPEEALDCFLRTKMDKLVLGNVIISRRGSAAADFNPPGKPPIQFERHAIICIGSNPG
jgi:carbamoyltransferase